MPRTSILNNKKAVQEAIKKNTTIKDCLIHLGLRPAGGNYKTFHNACERHGLEVPKEDFHKKTLAARFKITTPLEKILVKNSTYTNGTQIKQKILKAGIMKDICVLCGLGPEWNGKPITLQLDHINGIGNDHRIENLRILCPNCHTQTDNFAGRNLKKNNS